SLLLICVNLRNLWTRPPDPLQITTQPHRFSRKPPSQSARPFVNISVNLWKIYFPNRIPTRRVKSSAPLHSSESPHLHKPPTYSTIHQCADNSDMPSSIRLTQYELEKQSTAPAGHAELIANEKHF